MLHHTLGKCGTDVCTDTAIRESAKALVDTGLAAKGFEWVVLDDCWHPTRDDSGKLVPKTTWFPNGMEPVIDYVHSLGLKFGLYTSVGTETCRDDPGSYGYYEEDAQLFADWNVDYVKLDWCGDHRSVEGQKNFSAALNATGRPMVLELCRGDYQDQDQWGYAPEIAQVWRAANDHHDKFIDDKHGTLHQIQVMANTTAWSGAYGWSYGDMMMTGGQGCSVYDPAIPKHCPGQSDDEYRTEASLYGLLGSPMLVGTDIRDFTDIMKELLLNDDLLLINQDFPYTPAEVITTCGEFTAYKRPLSDGRVAVAVMNLDDDTTTVSICLGDIGSSGTWNVRDVWAKTDSTADDKISKDLKKHDTFLVILQEQQDVDISSSLSVIL